MANKPATKTFFTELKQYPHVSEDLEYQLDPVLEASAAFLPFFDVFGSMLKICKNDIDGNIKKLQKKAALVGEAKTFKQLLQYELDRGESKQKESACIAALWYKRGLQYITAFLEEFLDSRDENLTNALDKAYDRTLKRYHTWIVQKGIKIVSKLVPYRKDVITKLCNGNFSLEQQCEEEVKLYLVNLKKVGETLHNLIIDLGLDSEEKV